MAPAAAAEPVGEWLVANGSARIGIDNCDGALWGVVTWEKKPGTDAKNPDPAKRRRPTLHMPVLLAMVPAEEDRWGGKVYNAENGKTYTAHINLNGPDELQIEGCLLGAYLCGGETWKRYTPDESAPAKPQTGTPAVRTGSTKSTLSSPQAPLRGSIPPRPAAPAEPVPPPQSEVCAAVTDSSGASHKSGLK
jgi:uncharacterized protein (DUF2147 family)